MHDVLAAVALRVNAILGPVPASLQAAYATRPLTVAQFGSATFNFDDIKSSVLKAESKIAAVIAETGGHPYRSYLAGQTASLAHKAQLPSLSSAGKQIIGAYGAVYDASDGTEMTEQPIEAITLRVLNPNGFFRVPSYHYKLDGQRILHTRTGAIIDVCVYDRAARKTEIDSDGIMLLPDSLEGALVIGSLSILFRDDDFANQAAAFAQLFGEEINHVRGGISVISSKVIPGPTIVPSST